MSGTPGRCCCIARPIESGSSDGLRTALGASPWMLDRANVLVSLVVGSLSGQGTYDRPNCSRVTTTGRSDLGASDSTLWRMLGEIDDRGRTRIAKARAVVRTRVWELLADREGGFPWLVILGRKLSGWTVIDLDATVITCCPGRAGGRFLFLVLLMFAFDLFSHGSQDLYPTSCKKSRLLPANGRNDCRRLQSRRAPRRDFLRSWCNALGRRRAIVIAALLAIPVIPWWAYSRERSAARARRFPHAIHD